MLSMTLKDHGMTEQRQRWELNGNGKAGKGLHWKGIVGTKWNGEDEQRTGNEDTGVALEWRCAEGQHRTGMAARRLLSKGTAWTATRRMGNEPICMESKWI